MAPFFPKMRFTLPVVLGYLDGTGRIMTGRYMIHLTRQEFLGSDHSIRNVWSGAAGRRRNLQEASQAHMHDVHVLSN